MKEDIKEILNQLEKVKDGVGTFIGIDNKNANILLDYISNLQEENKRLKEQNKLTPEERKYVLELAKELEIDNKYKSRNEKAIEYINNLSNEPNIFGHYGIEGNCKKYLLNILQGSDKDDKDDK